MFTLFSSRAACPTLYFNTCIRYFLLPCKIKCYNSTIVSTSESLNLKYIPGSINMSSPFVFPSPHLCLLTVLPSPVNFMLDEWGTHASGMKS